MHEREGLLGYHWSMRASRASAVLRFHVEDVIKVQAAATLLCTDEWQRVVAQQIRSDPILGRGPISRREVCVETP